jgi:hypothetical protein
MDQRSTCFGTATKALMSWQRSAISVANAVSAQQAQADEKTDGTWSHAMR